MNGGPRYLVGEGVLVAGAMASLAAIPLFLFSPNYHHGKKKILLTLHTLLMHLTHDLPLHRLRFRHMLKERDHLLYRRALRR